MDHKQVAMQIYTDSIDLDRKSGARSHYRKQELDKIAKADRWVVKQHLNNIAVARMPKRDQWNLKS